MEPNENEEEEIDEAVKQIFEQYEKPIGNILKAEKEIKEIIEKIGEKYQKSEITKEEITKEYIKLKSVITTIIQTFLKLIPKCDRDSVIRVIEEENQTW